MQLRSQSTIWHLLGYLAYRLGEWRRRPVPYGSGRRWIRLTPKTIAGLLIWPLLFASYAAGRSTDLPFSSNVSAGTAPISAQQTVAKKTVQTPTAAASPAPATAQTATAASTAAPATLPGDKGLDPEPGPPQYAMAAKGTYANSYAAGNCTWYVASRRRVPAHWGNARNWLYSAQAAGWETGAAPRIGAIAWTPQGSLGHVALVVAINGNEITVAEMNYYGLYNTDTRTTSASAFKYIYQ